jgi:hypothetical protein
MSKWIRICQECGNKQEDKDPKHAITYAYLNKKCKKCKSEALDFGSMHSDDNEDVEALNELKF